MLSGKQQSIGLKEFIDRVKEELLQEHDEDNPLFAISEVELEIALTVERTLDGGINFQVVQTGVEKTMADVQTVKLTLEPLVTPKYLRKQLEDEKKPEVARKLMRGEE